ncbi:MAG: diguanylate phosphodiesterase [Deltaproteobacteria bacterium RIFOXYD12_FULL_56_24]|nr:MAG: diguanylate phosphodiesterase [Deltaproteobacteria bacterium RIFOXYD12_FULL_56_24]
MPDLPFFDRSLRGYLFSRIMGATLVVFVLVLATSTILYDRLIIRQSRDTARGIAGQTYVSIETLMPYGPSRQKLLATVEAIKKAHSTSPYQIEVYRSSLVDDQYGAVEGAPAPSETIRMIMTGAGRQEILENGTWTRHFYPLEAKPACLNQCHAGAEAGAVLGVVEVKQNVKNMAARMRSEYLWIFVLYGGLAIALVIFVTLLVVAKVTRAVEQFREKTSEIRSVVDLSSVSELGKSTFGFKELNQAFGAVGELAERLRDVAVDKDVLEFEIKILNKFIITSNVVQDWHAFVKELLVDINSIVDTYALMAFFQENEQDYELDIFWRSAPSDQIKAGFENLIQQQIYRRFQLAADSPSVRIIHHDSGSDIPLPQNLAQKDFELRTKSLFLETPKVGGIVGIGVQSNLAMDSIYHIVLDSVLATLINLVGSAKAIYKYTKDLEYYATRDPLTHLYNQRMFWELIGYETGRSDRHNTTFALLVIDLDNFKTVNDRYGHVFGDFFLQQIANSLRPAVRDGDIVARYGGDEFVILLPEASKEQAHMVVSRIIESVATLNIMTTEGFKIQCTISIGMAMYPEHGRSAKDIFLVADNMMYKAKEEGKNALAVAEESDIAEIFKHESEINFKVYQSLEQQNIIPYFQPIFDLESGTILAHEMLMRIPTTGGTVLNAGEFIEAAGRIGLLPKLDQLLMQKAYERANADGYPGKLFINLTPKSLIIPEFMPNVLELTKRYEINPNRIVFEVTERDTVRNMAMLQKFVIQMKSLGFKFAVDDFGSGYSSFKYLKLFPIDYIKIEGEFIRNMLEDVEYMAYTKSIVTLAKELKVKTVAEYVEDARIFEACRTLGIDYAQGYHVGKPGPEFSVQKG